MIRRPVVLVMIAIAVTVGACGDASTVSVTAMGCSAPTVATSLGPSSSTSIAVVTTTTNSGIASIRAQITKASTDICTLVSAQNVGVSFAQTVPLTTQPMGEASGPA